MPAPDTKFDLVVVGSGPGGYVAAIRASQLGQRVALVERDSLGGVCLNWGCIPSKALLRSAQLYENFKRADEFGLSAGEIGFDWAKIVQRSRRIADRSRRGVQYLMKKNSITVFQGRGFLLGNGRLGVAGDEGDLELTAEQILLAVGAHPRALPAIPHDPPRILTSREALVLERPPESILIVGAGAIGVEFAYLLSAFGSRVTLVEMLDRILPLEDEEVSEELRKIFSKRGVEILTSAKVSELSTSAYGCRAVIESSGSRRMLDCDQVLVSVGVAANVEVLGLEAAGVEVQKGFIKVDPAYRTTAPGVSAIGDCIGAPLLAHAASKEGIAAVHAMLGHEFRHIDPLLVPGAIYCEPQVASIGLSEKKALELGYDIQVGRFPFRPLGKALAAGNPEGFVKLVRDKSSGKVLGCHIIGSEATELIPELALTRWLDLDARALHEAVHPHPTLSEALMEAAADSLGEAIHL